MDPIITKLNQQVIEKLDKSAVSGPTSQPSGFQQTFDTTMADKLLEKMGQESSIGQNDITVLSAEDVHINVSNAEAGEKSAGPKEQYFDMFKEMNRDLLSLDSALETLTTPGLKMTPRQLLAMQAGVANTTIMAEGFSRFTDVVARGIQTIVQTQVG